jgi:Raf kinase inhibitor-like YbhB/YbcL family protein
MAFSLTSSDLADGQTVPMKHVFTALGGENLSPALSWSGAPEGTRSFAVTVYDPDAPTGSGWWHWTVFNIPASATGLPGGVGADGAGLPAGAGQCRTDYGAPGWGGPYPPKGDKPHRYIFTVHALGTDHLDLDANASGAVVGFNLHFNTLATASFTALFGH